MSGSGLADFIEALKSDPALKQRAIQARRDAMTNIRREADAIAAVAAAAGFDLSEWAKRPTDGSIDEFIAPAVWEPAASWRPPPCNRRSPADAFFGVQAWLRESPPIEALAAPPPSSISFVELWERIARGASAVLTCGLPDQPEDTVLEGLREDLTLRLSRVGEGAVWEHFNAYRTLNELIRAHLDADEAVIAEPFIAASSRHYAPTASNS